MDPPQQKCADCARPQGWERGAGHEIVDGRVAGTKLANPPHDRIRKKVDLREPITVRSKQHSQLRISIPERAKRNIRREKAQGRDVRNGNDEGCDVEEPALYR